MMLRSSPFRSLNDEPYYYNRSGRRPPASNIFAGNPFALPNHTQHADPYARFVPSLNAHFRSQSNHRPSSSLPNGVALLPASSGLAPLRPLGLNGGLLPSQNSCNDPSCCHHDCDQDRNYNTIWRKSSLPCSTSASSCRTNRAGSYTFATKDIVVRNQARVIRASYLTENAKFEADLTKYLDKKDASQVPERVVDMLISFINEDAYECYSALDEVTLNILAHSVGAKSVVEVSLKKLKDLRIDVEELGGIVATVLLSKKVDKNLTAWLKKYLEKNENWRRLDASRSFQMIVEERPEVYAEVERLLEFRQSPKDVGFRSL